MRNSSDKGKVIENTKSVHFSEKFKRKATFYLAFSSILLLIMMVQAILMKYTQLLSDITESDLQNKIKQTSFIQIIGSPCMIVIQLIIWNVSSSSSQLMKQLSFFRLLVQVGYAELSLEATVIPLGNAGINTYAALSAMIFIELLFLTLGFMAIELPAIANIIPFAFANIMLAARLQSLPISCMMLFILAVLALAIGYFSNHQIDKRFVEKQRLIEHNGEIYQSFLNLLPEGVAILSDDQHLKYVNSSMNRILGCSEENILGRLLGLNNADAAEDESDLIKGDFQKKSIRKRDNNAKEFAPGTRTLNLKNSLQSEEVNFSIIEISSENRASEKNQQPKILNQKIREDLFKNYHQRVLPFIPKSQLDRAQTYEIFKRDPVLAQSILKLEASKTFREDAKNVPEKLNTVEKEKSDDNESILRSQRQTLQNYGEQQNLAASNLNQEAINGDGWDPLSEDNKFSGNAFSFHSNSDQRSFTKKKTFQLEKKHTPEISFVGPMRNQLDPNSLPNGALGISQSMLGSHSSYFKIIPSQVLSPKNRSNDQTPKNLSGPKSSSENVIPQNIIQSNQSPSPDNKSPNKIHELKSQPDFPATSRLITTNKLKSANTVHTLDNPGRYASTTEPRAILEEVKPMNPSKKLISYVTKLKDLRAAYLSIMKKLKQDVEGRESAYPQTHKSWITAILAYLRSTLQFGSKSHKPSSQQDMHKKEEVEDNIKFNLKEENCCVVMNSKLKIDQSVERTLEVSLTPTLLNNVPYLLVLVKDTTERDLINRLRDTNNYKNTIMATVSHELRTPLNCIISMLDMLQQNIDEELANTYLIPATNSSKLLLSMINNILDFGQICAGMHRHYYEMFSLKEILQDTLSLFEAPAKSRGVELKFEWDAKIPQLIYSDPSRIGQIVINLLHNAIKFTYKGSITLKAESKGPQIVRIMVIDTGIGIKKEDVKMIFKAFGKLENEHLNPQEVGMGLKISQSLAYRLGPKEQRGIKVRSESGKGSCFFFTIESRLKQTKLPANNREHIEDISSFDEKKEMSPLNAQEDYKEIGEFKRNAEDEISELEDNSENETMKLGHNMMLFKQMNTLGKLRKSDIKSSFKHSRPSMESLSGILNCDNHSPNHSDLNVEGPQVFEADLLRNHQQRLLDTISMQHPHLQIPLNNSLSPTKVPSKLNFSFLPQTNLSDQQLKSSQLDEIALSGQLKSTLIPKTNEHMDYRKQSADGSSQSEPKSKALLLAASFDEKRKTSNDVVSIDFLKVFKGSVDANQLVNSLTSGSLKSPKSSFSFQHQKNCKCEDLLIVDDNDYNILALSQMLESFRFRVAKALNGEIAINLIKEKAKSDCCNAFQIVFMDCDMPVKDGFETTKELRELQKKQLIPTFPIIAVTAFVNEREIKRCFECGMDEYMNKPVKKDKIQEAVKKWCK